MYNKGDTASQGDRLKLNASFIRAVKQEGRYGEGRGGHGLALLVRPRATGGFRKSWIQRIRIDGRTTNIGLGPYPVVTLAEARRRALDNRRKVEKGIDPRRSSSNGHAPSFAQATDAVIAIYRTGWKQGGRTEQKWRTTLRDYAFPTLGPKLVDKITTADVMAVLVPIWHEKPVLARTLKQRIGAIMRWAVCQGFRADNPAGDVIVAGLPKQNGHTNHHRAVPHSQVASVIDKVRRSAALPTTRACFEFLILTAARTSEARLALWSEVDMDGAVWTVPGERMKSGREHRVPLSNRALGILKGTYEWQDGSDLVFPSRTGRPLGHSTLLHLMRRLRIDATPHGMRSSFRIWAAECTDTPREVAEAALAHVNRNQVEAAYLRSDLFDRRRALMDQWAAYLNKDHSRTINA